MKRIKLKQLLDVLDYDRESETEKIQICRPNEDWDNVDEVSTASGLLLPLYEAEILCMEAVDKDIIRIEIDWDKLDLYHWDDDKKEEKE